MNGFKAYIDLLNEASAAVLFSRLKTARAAAPKAKRHIATKVDAQVAKTIRRPSAPAFPWWTGGKKMTGWWSPSKAFTFEWRLDYSGYSGGNYHITQIVNNPSMFGITKKDIMNILEEWAVRRDRAADTLYRGLKNGKIDKFWPLEKLVMGKGWVRVVRQGTSFVEVEGNTEYIRKAVGVALVACPWTEGEEYAINAVDPLVGDKYMSSLEAMQKYAR